MEILQRARELRKSQTDAEKILWRHLRNRNLQGYKFRRQYPIGNYIIDFACISLKLAIEIDGSQHLQNQEYDSRRTRYLNRQGFEVIRFWNNDVFNDIDSILEALTLTLSHRERELELRE